MTKADDNLVRQHFGEFEGLLDKSGIVVDRSALQKLYQARTIQAGNGMARMHDEPTGIKLRNDSFLSFLETVDIVDGKLVRTTYVYRYISRHPMFAFRYDKDSRSRGKDFITLENGDLRWHPECHLHYLDDDEPHYKTHETNLGEILNFIKYCFI